MFWPNLKFVAEIIGGTQKILAVAGYAQYWGFATPPISSIAIVSGI